MLALAGLPATAGFIGKLYLIEALVEGDYTWLGGLHRGRDDDLARLLPAGGGGDVDAPGGEALPGAAPAIAGASPEADPIDPEAGRRLYLVAPALLAAAATVFFGVIPQPLVEFAQHAGASLSKPPLIRRPAIGCRMGVVLIVAAIAASVAVGVGAERRWPRGRRSPRGAR